MCPLARPFGQIHLADWSGGWSKIGGMQYESTMGPELLPFIDKKTFCIKRKLTGRSIIQ